MAIAQFKIDIFSEISKVCDFGHEFVVIDRVHGELAEIAGRQKGKDRDSAKLAMAIITAKKIKILKAKSGDADESLLDEAKKHKGIVATQDYGLRSRLKAEKIPLLTMRQKKYFVLYK